MKCIIMQTVLPKLKATLAIELYKKGYSQTKIAKILSISQAEVSNYLHGKRGKLLNIDCLEDILKEIENGKKLSEILCKYCDKIQSCL